MFFDFPVSFRIRIHRIEINQINIPWRDFASEDFRREVVDHVRGERARDLAFDLALGAVVEERLGGGNSGGCMCDLVREHLVLVGAAIERREPTDRFGDHPVGEIDGIGGSGQIGRHGHGPDITDG